MTQTIFITLVKAMGFCCPYAFLRSMRGKQHHLLATKLGVSRDTIRYWRKKIRRFELTCKYDGDPKCPLKRFGEIPRVDLDLLRVGLRDPFV